MNRTCPYNGKTCNEACGRYHPELKECADVAQVDMLMAISGGCRAKVSSFDDIYWKYVHERELYRPD